MADGKFISYLRVSTAKQGASGLGVEAQRAAVAAYLNGGRWSLELEVIEVESGKRDDRPKLAEALALCRIHGAVLVVAKLDRLSRDAAFLMTLQKSGVRFIAADMPEANELTIGIMAVVAQAERKMISTRTKAALAAKAAWFDKLDDAGRTELTAKGKATKLGGPKWDHLAGEAADKGRAAGIATRQDKAKGRAVDLAPILADIRKTGAKSLREIAAGLNERNIPTARGGAWSAVQVSRLLGTVAA